MAVVFETNDSSDSRRWVTLMACRGAKNTEIGPTVPSGHVVDAGPVRVAVISCGVHTNGLKRGGQTVEEEISVAAPVSEIGIVCLSESSS